MGSNGNEDIYALHLDKSSPWTNIKKQLNIYSGTVRSTCFLQIKNVNTKRIQNVIVRLGGMFPHLSVFCCESNKWIYTKSLWKSMCDQFVDFGRYIKTIVDPLNNNNMLIIGSSTYSKVVYTVNIQDLINNSLPWNSLWKRVDQMTLPERTCGHGLSVVPFYHQQPTTLLIFGGRLDNAHMFNLSDINNSIWQQKKIFNLDLYFFSYQSIINVINHCWFIVVAGGFPECDKIKFILLSQAKINELDDKTKNLWETSEITKLATTMYGTSIVISGSNTRPTFHVIGGYECNSNKRMNTHFQFSMREIVGERHYKEEWLLAAKHKLHFSHTNNSHVSKKFKKKKSYELK